MQEPAYVTVGKAGSVPTGELHAFEAGGRRITVANAAGVLYAFDDTCTHRGCSLADGDLEQTTVTCICHGSQFDVVTGAVVRGPAERPVMTHRVRVAGDDLELEA
jgi:nitrite reductase/ring-hydroxylating ferredoxin subunit